MGNVSDIKPTLVISFQKKGVKRKFEDKSTEMLRSTLTKIQSDEEAIKKLSKVLRTAFEVEGMPSRVIQRILTEGIFDHFNDIYYTEQPVPWWLREFASLVDAAQSRSLPYEKYRVTTKACRGYLFYALEGYLHKCASVQSQKDLDGKRWELLGRPFFRKAPPSGTPEDIRGLADTLLFLAPDIIGCISKKSQDDLHKLLSWFTIVLEWNVQDQKPHKSLTLQIERVRGEEEWSDVYSKCITLPPKNKRILVASRNVRKAICELSEAWHNPTAKSVLLSAWTGSGKEILATLLVDAMGVGSAQRIELSAAAIESAQKLQEEIRNRLGQGTPLKEQGKKERIIIFLDEIHHDAAHAQDVRSGLLRLMETGIVGWDERNEPIKLGSPLYILAGSLPPDRIRTLPPRDLWTRIEYTVELRHPLLIRGGDNKETSKTRKEAKDCLRDYFELFWCDQIKEWARTPGQIASVEAALSLLENKSLIKELSGKFAKELESPFKPLVSIRTIRSMVKRLLGKVVDEHRVYSGLTSESLRKRIVNSFGDWVAELFDQLVPEIDPRGLF
jgi:hypothetical protein